MDDVTIVTINGVDYYVGADLLQYLVVINNRLVNTSGSTIYLYGSIREYQNSQSGYPRITAQSYTNAVIQSSYNSSYSSLVVDDYSVKSRHINDSVLLAILTFFAIIMIWFKRS